MASELIARVADAFVDDAPIDWRAAAASAAPGPERSKVLQLQRLSEVRSVSDRSGARMVAASTFDSFFTGFAAVQLAYFCALTGIGWTAAAQVPASGPTQIAVFAAFTAAAAILWSSREKHQRVRDLENAYLSCAVAFSRPLVSAAVHASGSKWLQPAYTAIAEIYPEAFLAVYVWRFALDFPSVSRFTRFDRIGRALSRPIWIVGAALFLVNAFPRIAVGPLAVLLRRHRSEAFWFLLSVPIAVAIGAIGWRTRQAAGVERTRVARFSKHLAAGAGPFCALAFAKLASPPFNRWFVSAPAAQTAPIDLVVLAALAWGPVGTTFAVVADSALNVRVAITRTTQYLLTRRLLAIAIAAPCALLALLLFREQHRPMADVLAGPAGRALITAAALAIALLATRSALIKAVERAFGRTSVDHQDGLRLALERVRNARGTHEIGAVVLREVERTIGTRAILLAADGTAMDGSHVRPLPWPAGLAAVMHDQQGCLDVGADTVLFAALPPPDRQWLSARDVRWLAPIRMRDGRLASAIAGGATDAGFAIQHADRCWLESLAAVVAVATETSQAQTDEDAGFECPQCGSASPTRRGECGCPAAPVPAALPLRLHGKFELLRRLGSGGMGVVYLARDIRLDRLVAIKTLPSASPDAIARLEREARAMASLAHPGLAAIHGFEVWRRTPALIVEYCPAGTLSDRLKAGPVDVREALGIGRALADALTYMHRHNIAHRDIKPSNIGFTAEGTPKLLDFGLSVAAAGEWPAMTDHPNAARTAASGTPLYLPPESYEGRDNPFDRDLWGLALVMFESVAGEHPFRAERLADVARRVLREAPPAIEQWRANLDPRISDLFKASMSRDPEARIRTAISMRDSLDRLMTSLNA